MTNRADIGLSLTGTVFLRIQELNGQFDIELFASSRNYKYARYAFFHPDCIVVAKHAFS